MARDWEKSARGWHGLYDKAMIELQKTQAQRDELLAALEEAKNRIRTLENGLWEIDGIADGHKEPHQVQRSFLRISEVAQAALKKAGK